MLPHPPSRSRSCRLPVELLRPGFRRYIVGRIRPWRISGQERSQLSQNTLVHYGIRTAQQPAAEVGIALVVPVPPPRSFVSCVWVIPVNAPNPEMAFKVLEWWHTFPGITLTSLGILDHDYTLEGDTYTLTEVGTEHSMDHGQPTPYNSNWQNPIGELPGLREAQEITRTHASLDYYGPDWEPNIKPRLDEEIVKMILGDVAPADGVAALQEEFRAAGYID